MSQRGAERSVMSEPFDCDSCKESLYDRKYIQVNDVPHCIPCYDRLYANTCQECKELIEHNSRVSALGISIYETHKSFFFFLVTLGQTDTQRNRFTTPFTGDANHSS